MSRGLAHVNLRADVSPLTFEELLAECEKRFCPQSFGVRADDTGRTVWVSRPKDGLAVGVQQMQVARLGLEATLARAEHKLLA